MLEKFPQPGNPETAQNASHYCGNDQKAQRLWPINRGKRCGRRFNHADTGHFLAVEFIIYFGLFDPLPISAVLFFVTGYFFQKLFISVVQRFKCLNFSVKVLECSLWQCS